MFTQNSGTKDVEFDIVFRSLPCKGWRCLFVLNGEVLACGRLHREIDGAVLEAAELADKCLEMLVAPIGQSNEVVL